MKMRSTAQRAGAICTAAALAFAASAALAGPRYGDPGVTIIPSAEGGGWAYGTLGGTRNSTNRYEKLACTVSRTSATNAAGAEVKITSVTCTATDKNRVTATCVSSKEAFADALNGVSPTGLIDFRYNAGGSCTQITVYESSSLERKR
jgi:hypothetical protein